jgi:hypothetical protein
MAAWLAAGLTGCGGDEGDPQASDGTTATRPSSTARLEIVTPAAGAVVAGPVVNLKVGLTDAKIVDFTSTNLKPDEGHLHVLLDGRLISMTLGLEQQIPNVPAGSHVVRVEFVANDHAPFTPRVVREVTFEVS